MRRRGNVVALRHGAHSPAAVASGAVAARRRLLRQSGLRASDLTPVGRALLTSWSRAAAALALLDAYGAEHGFLDDRGEPRGFVRAFVSLSNVERLALKALEPHLKAKATRDPLAAVLADYGDDDA